MTRPAEQAGFYENGKINRNKIIRCEEGGTIDFILIPTNKIYCDIIYTNTTPRNLLNWDYDRADIYFEVYGKKYIFSNGEIEI